MLCSSKVGLDITLEVELVPRQGIFLVRVFWLPNEDGKFAMLEGTTAARTRTYNFLSRKTARRQAVVCFATGERVGGVLYERGSNLGIAFNEREAMAIC